MNPSRRMSVTLVLEDEIDISRGDMLASAHQPPEVARQFEAAVVWMSDSRSIRAVLIGSNTPRRRYRPK